MIKDIISSEQIIYINNENDCFEWVYPDFYNFDPNYFYLFNFSSENWGVDFCTGLENHLKDKVKNYIVLVNDVKNHQIKKNIFYFPYWYIWSQKNFGHVLLKNDRSNLISCANWLARNHRIHNYLQLKQKSYFNSIYFTMSNEIVKNNNDEYVCTQEELIRWENEKNTNLEHRNNRRDSVLNLPMFTDSYLNIISETTANSQSKFLSEKSWKPIACEQLFLMLGNPGLIQMIKDHGVDVYDDLIDHKYYDSELDFVTRVKKMHSVLDNLVKNDIKSLFDLTKDRRIKNRENFYNMYFGATYIKEIKEYVSSCGISTLVSK